MAFRAPHLYQSLRAFCLAAFAAERGAELPFAFEEHPTRDGPSLYEYRPLVRTFVAEQAPTLRRLPDTRNAIEDLRREPAAAIFAHAHSGIGATDDDALFRTILLPTLTAVAERSGGFDWQDDAFEAAYTDIERSLFGDARSYAAIAPLVGLSAGSAVDLGDGIGVRHTVPGELSGLWPESLGLMPPEFGRDVDRLCVLELTRELDAGEGEPPDAAAELADAVSALRLATAGAIAAGPVVFERLDFRPLRISPLLPSPPPSRAGRRSASTPFARGWPPTCARDCRSPTTTASSARRSTAGSSRCSPMTRSGRARCEMPSPRCSGRKTGLGRLDALRRPARGAVHRPHRARERAPG